MIRRKVFPKVVITTPLDLDTCRTEDAVDRFVRGVVDVSGWSHAAMMRETGVGEPVFKEAVAEGCGIGFSQILICVQTQDNFIPQFSPFRDLLQ